MFFRVPEKNEKDKKRGTLARRDKGGKKRLLNNSWSLKSTISKKLLYVSSLSEFFSLVRKERKGQKEESIPLLNTFCRLAATSANKVPRPSRYSLTMATGSKRSSADSDSLLCHVRLRRTSRLIFGCGRGLVCALTKSSLHLYFCYWRCFGFSL